MQACLTIDASGNDPTPNSTLDDGDDTNDGDGSRVFNVDDGVGNSLSMLSVGGLTLTGGDASGAGGAIKSFETLMASGLIVSENLAETGGGISVGGNGSIISDSRIEDNSAGAGGGIFVTAAGTVTIEHVVVKGNSAGAPGGFPDAGKGGGILVVGFGGDVIIRHSTIADNSADLGGGIANSEILIDDLKLSVEDCLVENNSSTFGGGGIRFLDGGTLPFGVEVSIDVARSVIRGNTATTGGGGLLLGGEATISDSLISENSAGQDGGGLNLGVDTDETIVVSRSTIERNRGRDGGGIYLFGGPPFVGRVQIVDSTLSANEAMRNGGGTYRSGSDDWLEIRRSTITANRAGTTGATPRTGGGIYNSATFAKLTLDHSIMAANSDNSGNGPDLFGSSPQLAIVDFSLIGYFDSASLPEAPVGSPDANGNLIGGPVNGVIDPLVGAAGRQWRTDTNSRAPRGEPGD